MPAQPNPPESMGDLLRRAAANGPGRIALIDGSTRLTWADLQSDVGALASALGSSGFVPGDRVAIQSPTSVDFVAVYLAASQAGLVVVPVNPGYTVAELGHILADSGARMLITSSVAAVAAEAQLREEHSALERIAVAASSGAGDLPTVADLLAAGKGLPAVRRDRTGEDLAVLLYTSGTSGRPKGAMLSVRALLANLAQFAELQPTPVTADDRLFLPLPLFHIFGLNAGLGMALAFGATAVLSSKFDVAEAIRTMRQEQVTIVVGAPVEFAAWAGEAAFAEAFSHVRFALSGSAPLPPDLVATYAAVGVALFEGYGLTEAAPAVTVNLVPRGAEPGWFEPKAGSIGRPLPGVEVRLLDSDGEVVEPGDLGLLEVRGANLFSGYWPDSSGGQDDEGWFATGDLAVTDDDGDYHLVGRRTDLILVNGFNVYPAEVEGVFRRMPGVREVAVLGQPQSETTDEVVAYVVAQDGVTLDVAELLAEATRSLARFKLPKHIVPVDRLPRTATGTVMKWRLRVAAIPRDTVPGLARPDSSGA